MIIDLNDISKACYQNKYDTYDPPSFDDSHNLSDDNVNDLIDIVNKIENNDGYLDFRKNLVNALKTLFALAYIKQVNLNEFFKVSLNLDK